MNEPFQTASTDDDLLPVVDECDKLIGVIPRRQVHLERLRHRAVQIGVVDPEGRVWLQKRAATKDSYPGYWDLGATGHVDPGESYDEAARRELREELGIEAEPVFAGKVEASAETGWEFQALYGLRWAGAIERFHPGEIERMGRFTLEEIRALVAGGEAAPERLTPSIALHLPVILKALGIADCGLRIAE